MRDENDAAERRAAMVCNQLQARGIVSHAVLQAMGEVPRERFIDTAMEEFAYEDSPLPIGEGQTISQPYIVAAMIEAAEVRRDERVLEVGAGSGYATAVLSRLAGAVCAIERHAELVRTARKRLQALHCSNVDLRSGDGTLGWPESGQFDAILVSAAGAEVPAALQAQLAPGGRLVMPVGDYGYQQLVKLTRTDVDAFDRELIGRVRFVPLVGAHA
jgi:protein-L-isoaspartate(D-aspartate) O-methyltransferase